MGKESIPARAQSGSLTGGGFRLVVHPVRNLGDDMWGQRDGHSSGYCLRGSF